MRRTPPLFCLIFFSQSTGREEMDSDQLPKGASPPQRAAGPLQKQKCMHP